MVCEENLLRPSEKTECCKAENVVTLEDIFNNDDLNLLDVGNTDIFRIEHIQQRTINGAPYTDEDNAVRQPCTDFWRFEAWFKQIHHMLKHGKAHFERLKTETFLSRAMCSYYTGPCVTSLILRRRKTGKVQEETDGCALFMKMGRNPTS